MVCLIKEKYKEELKYYTELLGSEDRAYAVLCCNNGFTLDKTKDGKPSNLYTDLLKLYNGDVSKALQKKALYFTEAFTKHEGMWFEDGFEMSDKNRDKFDENGEPKLSEPVKQMMLRNPGISEKSQQKSNKPQLNPDREDNVSSNRNANKKTSVMNILRKMGFVHKFHDAWFLSKRKFTPDANYTFNYNQIVNSVKQALQSIGLSPHVVTFKLSESKNSVRCSINENAIDAISEDNHKITQIEARELFSKLKTIIPSLRKIQFVSDLRVAGITDKEGVNACVKNGVVYINENGFYSKDIVIEECLHSFVNDLYFENSEVFNSLLSRARTEFPQLVASIYENYSNEENFTQSDRDQELVTQVLSRYMRKELEKPSKKLLNIIQNFITWLKSKLEDLFINPNTGKYTIDANFFITGMTFEDVAQILNSDDVVLQTHNENNVRYNKNSKKRLQEAKKNIKHIFDSGFEIRDVRTNTERRLDGAIEMMLKSTQSKDKSYKSKAHLNTASFGDERQIAHNQESVRLVKQQYVRVQDVIEHGTAEEILSAKAQAIIEYLDVVDSDIQAVSDILDNAKSNFYNGVYYNVNTHGVREYTDGSNNQLTAQSATSSTVYKQFTFDDISYITSDITEYYENFVKNITIILEDLDDSNPVVAQLRSVFNTLQFNDRLQQLNRKRRLAQEQMLDQYIDAKINEQESAELTPELKNRLSINMKKWLRAQYDFGDINAFMRTVGILSDSKSPLARMLAEEIYNMNTEVDLQTTPVAESLYHLFEAAQRENSFVFKKPGNFLTQLMGKDRRGLFTGDFVKPINERQYYQDFEDYKASLLFSPKYGLEKRIREIINDDTFKLELDDYNNPIFPTPLDQYQELQLGYVYKDYRLSIERFMCERTNRRFTYEYYKTRIETLSIKTLKVLDAINNQINEIRKSCTVDGNLRLDLLTQAQRTTLAQLQKDRESLADFYDEFGEPKTDLDELQIAQDLQNLRFKMRGKVRYVADTQSFNDTLSRITSTAERDFFRKLFSHVDLNPEMYEDIIRKEYIGDDDNIRYLIEQRYRLMSELNSLIKRNKPSDSLTSYVYENIFDLSTGEILLPSLLENIKNLDLILVEINAQLHALRKANPADWKGEGNFKWEERFQSSLYGEKVLTGTSGYDFVNSVNGSAYLMIRKQYVQYLVNQGMSTVDAETLAAKTLTSDGQTPLSLFYTLTPAGFKNTFVDAQGNVKKSYTIVPNGMFYKVDTYNSDPKYVNLDYDEFQNKPIQPKDEYYHDDRYDKMRKQPHLSALYDGLMGAMEDVWSKIPFLQAYDGRLPQIGGDSTMVYSRKNPISAFVYNIKRKLWANETDTELYKTGEIKRPNGSKIKNIPVMFVDRVDDAAYISSDIVGNVIQMVRMANNYWVKSQHIGRIETILSNVRENEKTTSNIYKAMESAVDRQVYGQEQKTTLFENEWNHLDWVRRLLLGGSNTFLKRLKISRNASQRISLAFRLVSMIVSYLDPLMSTFIEAGCGRYYTGSNLIKAIFQTFKELPAAAMSIGRSRSYSRTMAIMDALGMSGEMQGRYKYLYKTTARKILGKEFVMLGFELGDYNIKALNTNAIFENYRLYIDVNGDGQFLDRDSYLTKCMEDGLTLREAHSAYNHAKTARNCVKSVHGVLEFTHPAMTKEQFKKIGSVAKKISQTVTLMANNLEKTDIQAHPWGSFITTLRTFMLVALNERFRSYDDFITAEHDGNTTDKKLTKADKKEARKNHYYRGGYNFLTGRIENGVYTSGFSGIGKILSSVKHLKYWLSHFVLHYGKMTPEQLKKSGISEAELYNAHRILLEFTTVVACATLSIMFNKFVSGLDPDDDRNWIFFLINIVMMRLGIERVTMYNPGTISEIITSITTVTGAYSKVGRIYDLLLDMTGISGHDPDEIIKSNSQFNGKTRMYRDLINAGAYWGTAGWYSSTPKALGGGGGKSLNKNADYYEKVAPWTNLYPESEKKSHANLNSLTGSSGGRGGRGGRSSSRSGR